MKEEKGIALSTLIIIITVIILVGGICLYFIMTNSKTNVEANRNTIQNQENKNSINTNLSQSSQLSIDEIKKQNYPDIFGEEGTGIYPPQSYITHNILSINPSKDEKFIVTNATSNISTSSGSPEFTYLINEKDNVEIEINFVNPERLIIQEKVDNTDIFVHKSANNSTSQNLTAIRYILLEDILYYHPNTAYSNYKCYIVLKPSTEIQNEEIVKIAQHIVIDKTRGEFLADGVEGLKITANEEELRKNVGDYVLNFENAIITDWRVYDNGLNEINYYIMNNEKYTGLTIEFPYTTALSNSQNGIEDIKASIENVNKLGKITQELAEIEIDGIKFYGLKETVPSAYSCYVTIYVELEGNELIRFSNFGKIEDTKTLEDVIRQLISNKILYKN